VIAFTGNASMRFGGRIVAPDRETGHKRNLGVGQPGKPFGEREWLFLLAWDTLVEVFPCAVVEGLIDEQPDADFESGFFRVSFMCQQMREKAEKSGHI
jgi:hypothetical protein